MKFTLNWLKEHLDTAADLQTILHSLTSIGLEVEHAENPAESLAGFTVAEILEATQHPDADRLRVCKVKSDSGDLQIVCGAPNARAGIKVALAKVGALIPNGGFTIKQSKIRGVESCGMLCSADELGLGKDASGIIELPQDAPIGASIVDVLGLNDPVIEIAITPNRGDCLGVYGIARDLAAKGIGTLKPLKVPSIAAQGAAPITVTLTESCCKMFVGRVIRGVRNGPSPDWLQQRLKAIGLRPISTLVDITNLMTIGYGRPLHVYDVSKLTGNITVREAKAGETCDALNDKSYTLQGGECVIADDAGMLGLGGIVGGVPSGVTDDTTDVLLECAWFEPTLIAKTGRKLGVESDARYRFERTVDPDFVKTGADIATQMILELCGGSACDAYIAGQAPSLSRSITVNSRWINQFGGIELNAADQIGMLQTLGFDCSVTSGDSYQVTAPSWRPDIEQQADIAEEILRIYGYDRVPDVAMPKLAEVSPAALRPAQSRERLIRRTLAGRALHETHSWAFMAEPLARHFGYNHDGLALVNPISSDLSVMRPSLLPNLIQAATRNLARGFDSVNLFEVGPQFRHAKPDGQDMVACAVRVGASTRKQWMQDKRIYDCFDAKADAFAVLESCGMDPEKLQLSTQVPSYYHPGRSGAVMLGPKTVLAYFGEIHPSTLRLLDSDDTVVACEVMIGNIPQTKQKAKGALAASDYQATDRDFAFVMDADKPVEDLLKAVRNAEKALVSHVRLFDVYQGKGVEEGKKSVAITVRLQAADRTLTEADIESVSTKVTQAAAKTGALLRA